MLSNLKWCIFWFLVWNIIQFIGYLLIPEYNLFTSIVGLIISIFASPIAWLICVLIDYIELKKKHKI